MCEIIDKLKLQVVLKTTVAERFVFFWSLFVKVNEKNKSEHAGMSNKYNV